MRPIDPTLRPTGDDDALFEADNRPRFPGRTDGGLHESWFLRASHPHEPRAVWLKATVLAEPGGPTHADVWCCTFDGDSAWGGRERVPLHEARFGGRPLAIEIGGSRFQLGAGGGGSSGALENERGAARWDVGWKPVPGPLGRPMCILPTRWMTRGPIPKTKPVTPSPLLRFEGTVTLGGRPVSVDGWYGAQGHNWGRGHQYHHVWGQAAFLDAAGEPHCVLEGAASRVQLGGRLVLPPLSPLVVRRGDRTYRFTQVFRLWKRTVHTGDLEWSVRLRSPDGEAMLTMRARPERTVCLGYDNPSGVRSYCLNSKVAHAVLRVNPVNEDGFECVSPCGAALEFVSREPDPRFPDPI